MKKIILLMLAVIMLPTISYAQDKKLSKDEKKAIEMAQKQALYEKGKKAITERNFMVEAQELSFNNEKAEPVSPGANFVSLNGDEAEIQIFPRVYPGMQSPLDINIKGTATNVETKVTKKGEVTLKMHVKGTKISAMITVRMNKNDNTATAIIRPDFSGNRITLNGNAYLLQETKEYIEKESE